MAEENAIQEAEKEGAVVQKEPAKRRRKPAENIPAEAAENLSTVEESKEIVEEKPKKKVVPLELNTGGVLLFGKYPTDEVVITDRSMQSTVRFNAQPYPNIFGRRRRKSYYDTHISVVERLMNKLMRGGTGKKIGGKVIRTSGRLQGKKLKVMHIVEDAFERIKEKTGKNPVQVFVDALQNSAPIEDTTRVRYGGISYNVAVGISANRRVDVALKNIALASLIGAFKKKKRLSEALGDELMQAAQNSPDSYAIKKRVESERIARRAR